MDFRQILLPKEEELHHSVLWKIHFGISVTVVMNALLARKVVTIQLNINTGFIELSMVEREKKGY